MAARARGVAGERPRRQQRVDPPRIAELGRVAEQLFDAELLRRQVLLEREVRERERAAARHHQRKLAGARGHAAAAAARAAPSSAASNSSRPNAVGPAACARAATPCACASPRPRALRARAGWARRRRATRRRAGRSTTSTARRRRRFAALERPLREGQRERVVDKLGHRRVSENGGDFLGAQRHHGEEAEALRRELVGKTLVRSRRDHDDCAGGRGRVDCLENRGAAPAWDLVEPVEQQHEPALVPRFDERSRVLVGDDGVVDRRGCREREQQREPRRRRALGRPRAREPHGDGAQDPRLAARAAALDRKSPDGPARPKRASGSVTTAGGGASRSRDAGLMSALALSVIGVSLAHARRASGRGVDDGVAVGGGGAK